MRVTLKVLLLILLIPTVAQSQPPPDPYILFSPNGRCSSDGTGCWSYFQTYYVFIEMRDVTDAVGASFRLESPVFGPEDFVAVTPHDGVTIVSGDIFSGIELAWAEGSYVSDTLLTIPISLMPPHDDSWNSNRTLDVEVYRANGETLQLVNGSFYCSHCYGGGGGIWWLHPDTLEVPVGTDTTLAIKCDAYSSGGTGTYIDASDTANWLTGCPQCSVWAPCGGCPWDYQYVLVDLSIPTDAGGTHTTVTLVPTGPCCTGDPTSFVVSAVAPVATEKTSWGSMKARYRKK